MSEQQINETEEIIQLIVFRLGKEEYAFPVMSIQEIITVQPHTRIPKSPDYVEGVINLRGNILPIINAKKKFKIDSKDEDVNIKDKRIIIVETNEEVVGVVVDNVSEVIYLDSSQIEPPPVDAGAESYLSGVGKYKDRLIILLNKDKFLEITDEHDIDEFLQATEIIKNASV